MKYFIFLMLLSGCSIELSHTNTYQYEYDLPNCSNLVLSHPDSYVSYTYSNGDTLYVSRTGDGSICVTRGK